MVSPACACSRSQGMTIGAPQVYCFEPHQSELCSFKPDTLLDISEQMTGKTICVLSDSCAAPVVSGINKFRGDFEGLVTRTKHPVAAAVGS